MTQLILDSNGSAVVLPESQKRGYTAKKMPLSQDVQMITGRVVRELKGNAWVITYQYGFLDTELKNAIIAACEKGKNEPITCGFLPPTSEGELIYSEFWVEDFSYPVFMWSRLKNFDGIEASVPMWADFSLTLREVKPSD